MAMGTVTIVMYHYVRDLRRSRYPRLKALDLDLFREQLAYIKRHYVIITMEELIFAVEQRRGAWRLPPNAALLTFDDGYLDHFINVFPLLDEMRVQGSFFPPARAIRERKVLDVNKIHFVLAACEDPSEIADTVWRAGAAHGLDLAVANERAPKSRHDRPEVAFIKRALQSELPREVRAPLLDKLFARYVTEDEAAFAAELYMNVNHLRCLMRHGMFIGCHSDDHVRLGQLDAEEQARQIDGALEFLVEIGVDLDGWVMCYPYGDVNETLLEILRARRCRIGLTTRVGLAGAENDPLLLPRLDTNDLPKRADAPPNQWATHAGLNSYASQGGR
jgi:peptidoglycan/xylan/chitin deacetylase (PgdA/CDA1 family)